MNNFTLRTLILLSCFLGAYVLLQGVSGVNRTPILQPLNQFPKELGTWKEVQSSKSSAAVIAMLGVDDYINYNYRDAKGRQINFYAAYYESVGTGGGYHSPKNCLPGGGWGISSVKEVQISPLDGSGKPVSVTEMIIRNRDEYQVVYYWYQNRGRIIASEYWEKIYLVLDAIFKKRRDGSFIRIMAFAPDGNISAAEEELNEFSSLALAELRRFIPGS